MLIFWLLWVLVVLVWILGIRVGIELSEMDKRVKDGDT